MRRPGGLPAPAPVWATAPPGRPPIARCGCDRGATQAALAGLLQRGGAADGGGLAALRALLPTDPSSAGGGGAWPDVDGRSDWTAFVRDRLLAEAVASIATLWSLRDGAVRQHLDPAFRAAAAAIGGDGGGLAARLAAREAEAEHLARLLAVDRPAQRAAEKAAHAEELAAWAGRAADAATRRIVSELPAVDADPSTVPPPPDAATADMASLRRWVDQLRAGLEAALSDAGTW